MRAKMTWLEAKCGRISVAALSKMACRTAQTAISRGYAARRGRFQKPLLGLQPDQRASGSDSLHTLEQPGKKGSAPTRCYGSPSPRGTQLGATRRYNLISRKRGLGPNWKRRVKVWCHGSCGKHAPRKRSAPQQGQWARDIPDTYPGCACARHAPTVVNHSVT
jgi:hypothetical protein